MGNKTQEEMFPNEMPTHILWTSGTKKWQLQHVELESIRKGIQFKELCLQSWQVLQPSFENISNNRNLWKDRPKKKKRQKRTAEAKKRTNKISNLSMIVYRR